jgi:hypothetical protein
LAKNDESLIFGKKIIFSILLPRQEHGSELNGSVVDYLLRERLKAVEQSTKLEHRSVVDSRKIKSPVSIQNRSL